MSQRTSSGPKIKRNDVSKALKCLQGSKTTTEQRLKACEVVMKGIQAKPPIRRLCLSSGAIQTYGKAMWAAKTNKLRIRVLAVIFSIVLGVESLSSVVKHSISKQSIIELIARYWDIISRSYDIDQLLKACEALISIELELKRIDSVQTLLKLCTESFVNKENSDVNTGKQFISDSRISSFRLAIACFSATYDHEISEHLAHVVQNCNMFQIVISSFNRFLNSSLCDPEASLEQREDFEINMAAMKKVHCALGSLSTRDEQTTLTRLQKFLGTSFFESDCFAALSQKVYQVLLDCKTPYGARVKKLQLFTIKMLMTLCPPKQTTQTISIVKHIFEKWHRCALPLTKWGMIENVESVSVVLLLHAVSENLVFVDELKRPGSISLAAISECIIRDIFCLASMPNGLRKLSDAMRIRSLRCQFVGNLHVLEALVQSMATLTTATMSRCRMATEMYALLLKIIYDLQWFKFIPTEPVNFTSLYSILMGVIDNKRKYRDAYEFLKKWYEPRQLPFFYMHIVSNYIMEHIDAKKTLCVTGSELWDSETLLLISRSVDELIACTTQTFQTLHCPTELQAISRCVVSGESSAHAAEQMCLNISRFLRLEEFPHACDGAGNTGSYALIYSSSKMRELVIFALKVILKYNHEIPLITPAVPAPGRWPGLVVNLLCRLFEMICRQVEATTCKHAIDIMVSGLKRMREKLMNWAWDADENVNLKEDLRCAKHTGLSMCNRVLAEIYMKFKQDTSMTDFFLRSAAVRANVESNRGRANCIRLVYDFIYLHQWQMGLSDRAWKQYQRMLGLLKVCEMSFSAKNENGKLFKLSVETGLDNLIFQMTAEVDRLLKHPSCTLSDNGNNEDEANNEFMKQIMQIFRNEKNVIIIKNIMSYKQCDWHKCSRKDVILSVCNRCNRRYYCSRCCQKKDWTRGRTPHKYSCKIEKEND